MDKEDVAIVAIGRNEGDRLVRCLQSVRDSAALVVYVDSGSSDGSVAAAQLLGAEVVSLDLSTPFTAARARNAGWHHARAMGSGLQWVQFVDGDCELAGGWLETARAFLEAHPRVGAVCGQRRERFPERSIYNRLCDLEWKKVPGQVPAFGGDVMMRAEALRQARGYRDDLIAGEEPELCVRLRAQGWQIHALADAMTLHDAAMTRFGQWWQRVRRSGYAYAQGAYLHGAPPHRHNVREVRRAWVWGLVLPLFILLGGVWAGPWALLAVVVYPLQVLRLYFRGSGPRRDRVMRALFHTLGRFPEMLGQVQFLRDRLLRRRSGLIEYK
jgi:glycosyltransferase involved in cell wall biosynthesis